MNEISLPMSHLPREANIQTESRTLFEGVSSSFLLWCDFVDTRYVQRRERE